ncbi:3-hydroxyacyl-CoA dehydrogenase NAD-binding domain-containing protein [Microaerobacter geothermalis]|uniref:3-hydroxyacyl-CoA dehydrogenase family protein n=1 Tax=Microaerobacter geothermalis TaxID=674972 RepID=UPI001F41F5F2|nr:3-hydroxyacyl-CoA dehydrogenase NAD-binding domain-containing protein [Microaerobacter geothermalis]MCF6093335.1 3-hydroxyacyl-CoA dehydrogenase NAD-binding domain-containing protein [Microaerobacter geothermalis]
MGVKKVGVIGAGTMGQGISEMLAEHGIDVLLIDKTTRDLEHARRNIEISLDRQLEKWAITEAEKKVIMSKIQFTLDIHLLREADLVIESIIEDLEAKKRVFKQLDEVCSKNTILASNTSTLSLTEIAAATSRPDKVIGLHFLHPVAKIDLVEMIRGLKTSDETVAFAKRFVNQINKEGIQVYESPGFVTTRLIVTLINEALHTLMEGVASAEDIDKAMKIGYDFHYGPLEMADRFGLDSVLASMERLFRDYGDLKYRPSPLLRKMVRANHLGVKTGEGFFKYDENGERIVERSEEKQ